MEIKQEEKKIKKTFLLRPITVSKLEKISKESDLSQSATIDRVFSEFKKKKV